jgi:hypothetical protein
MEEPEATEEKKKKKKKEKPNWSIVQHVPAVDRPMTDMQLTKRQQLELESADITWRDGAFVCKSRDIALMGLLPFIEDNICPEVPLVLNLPVKRTRKKRKRDTEEEKAFFKATGWKPHEVADEFDLLETKTRERIPELTGNGRIQGLLVDRQLTAIVEHQDVPTCRGQWKYAEQSLDFWDSSVTPVSRSVAPFVHPFVFCVLSTLLDKHWVPVAAQVPVFNERRGVATAADLLWWSPKSKTWIMIEVKCRRKASSLREAPFKMNPPFDVVQNTQQNRDLLQASFTRDMLVDTYASVRTCRAYVARVHSDTCKCVLVRVTPLIEGLTRSFLDLS